MTLTDENLKVLTDAAVAAAEQAGALIASYLDKELKVEHKEGRESLASSVLTEVDLLAQELIAESLADVTAALDLAFLAEESADDGSRFEKDYFWCIDPIDGTLPFIERVSGFAPSIALIRQDGTPMIGAVCDPFHGVLYHASAGCGAFRDGASWQLPEPGDRLTLICDRSLLTRPGYASTLEALERIAATIGRAGVDLISHGGAAMNACWVLEKASACYITYPRKDDGGGSVWDYAATACIFNEIGAVCTDAFGDPLELNRRESTFLNHRGVIYASDEHVAAMLRDLLTRG
jgi:3'(2'), 5'-bisphosphate nucleotidase/myo-inositol-1(or 4)-monophosphatase